MSNKKMQKYDFSAIVDRIMEHKKLSNEYNVADLLGFKQSTFSDRKKRNSIPFEELFEFSENEGIYFEWLMTGKGEKYKNTPCSETHDDYVVKVVQHMVEMDDDTKRRVEAEVAEKKLLMELKRQMKDKEADQ